MSSNVEKFAEAKSAIENAIKPSGELDLETLQKAAGLSQTNLAELLADAELVQGRALTDKETLIGTPLVITSVTFRPKGKRDYASVEYTTLSKPHIDAVFNDGGTGIRRQLVAYLADKGLLPAAYKTDPDATVATPAIGNDGIPVESSRRFDGLKLVASRGLRVSTYEYDGENAATYYLA